MTTSTMTTTTMTTNTSTAGASRVRWLALAAASALGLAITGCDDSSETEDTSFECTEDRAGWEQCDQNMVQWCHAEAGMDPHFHWGSNCEDLGLVCVELSESEAACVDTSSSCTAGEARCEQSTAYNCLPDGHWAVEPCVGAAACVEQSGAAICEDQCAAFDPQQACDVLASAPEQKQVTETFADVFDAAYHAELATPIQVTLPDSAASYIHFPVMQSGEYVVFLDTADVLDSILDRNETDMTPSGGGANSACPSELTDHYHAELTYDGGGTDPVPFVIRFRAVSSQTITFIVLQKC